MHTTYSCRGQSRALVLRSVLVMVAGAALAAPAAVAADASLLLAHQTASVPLMGLAGLPGAEAAHHDEAALRHALQQATWPADITRLADAYLHHHGQQAWAPEAAWLLQRALPAAALLRRNDVPLFRAAFAAAAVGDDAALADMRLAGLGDAAAAWRQAGRTALQPGAAANLHRHIGWLRYAAALGSQQAAYALALHYRSAEQPLLAAQFETRAVALGHVMPLALDHARK